MFESYLKYESDFQFSAGNLRVLDFIDKLCSKRFAVTAHTQGHRQMHL